MKNGWTAIALIARSLWVKKVKRRSDGMESKFKLGQSYKVNPHNISEDDLRWVCATEKNGEHCKGMTKEEIEHKEVTCWLCDDCFRSYDGSEIMARFKLT